LPIADQSRPLTATHAHSLHDLNTLHRSSDTKQQPFLQANYISKQQIK
jgi:hypothetical protein